MEEKDVYATTIKITFYDDNFDVRQLFKDLQNLKAKDYLKLYQMMYQHLLDSQTTRYVVLDEDFALGESE